jgi:hypothetical protein
MYVLDACTAINIVHIDADEFIQKKIERLGYYICKLVSTEIQKHAFDKFRLLSKPPEDEVKRINIALTYYRNRIYYPEDYLNLAEEIVEMTGYTKVNGEFHSVLLSFFLYRLNTEQTTLVTDDSPANEFFTPYFLEQGIGKIEDLVDLLNFLQTRDDDFTVADLKKYLSNLFYEVGSLLKGIENDINKFQIPKNQIKNRAFRQMLENIRKAVHDLDLKKLHYLYHQVLDHKHEYLQLHELLIKYSDFFNQNISTAYFEKIRNSSSIAS